MAQAIVDALVSGGFRVKVARNGEEAVRSAQEEPPSVVLLDLGLPELSGHSVLHELREYEATSLIPVVVVTGYPDLLPDDDRPLVQALVRKPFDVQSLISAVRKAAQERPGARVSEAPVPPGEV